MSQFKGHVLGGLVAYGAVVFLFSLTTVPLATHLQWIIATFAGALFPDIDIKSKGQHLFLKILLLLLILCLFLHAYIPVVLVLIFSLLPLIIPHRGLFHDLSFIVLITAAIDLVLIFVLPYKGETIITTSLFFLLGVFSHLLLDKGVKKTFSK